MKSKKRRKPVNGTPEVVQHTAINDVTKFMGYTVLSIGTGLGTFFLVDHFIKKIKETSTSKKSLVAGDPASYAAKLYKALDLSSWWSEPDKLLLFQELRLIPSKLVEKVKQDYQITYNRDLSKDLQKYLTADEFNEAQRIIAQEA